MYTQGWGGGRDGQTLPDDKNRLAKEDEGPGAGEVGERDGGRGSLRHVKRYIEKY